MSTKNFTFDGTTSGFRDKVYEALSNPVSAKDFFIKYVTIWMSRECNSKCKHCYQKGSPRGNGWTFEKADQITDLFLKDGYIVYPLVNEWLPHYWDFLEIKKKCGSTEITTNGIYLTKRHRDLLPLLHKNGIKTIKLTIFPKGVHEIITGRDRENVLNATRISLDSGFRVIYNYVVMQDTLHKIPEFVDEAYNMGVNEIFFMGYFCVDIASSMYKQVLSNHDIQQFWKYWVELRENSRYKDIKLDHLANLGPNPYGDNVFKEVSRQKKFCLAGNWEHLSFLYIEPEGGIYPCNMLNNSKYQIGEIYKENEKYAYKIYENHKDWEGLLVGYNRTLCGGHYETSRIRSSHSGVTP